MRLIISILCLCLSLTATSQVDVAGYNKLIDQLIQDQYEQGLFNGMALVTMGDQVILHKSYGYSDVPGGIEFNGDEAFFIASVTKQFTAALILRAQDQGLLDVNQPLATYLSEFSHPDYSVLTTYHLLTHTSSLLGGLHFKQSDDRWVFDFEGEELPPGLVTQTPGSQVRYTNTAYHTLGVLLERIYDQSYAEILNKEILTPLDMQDTGLEIGSHSGSFATGHIRTVEGLRTIQVDESEGGFAAAGMYSTTVDLHKWLGALATQDVLSEAAKQIMFSPYKNGYSCGWLVESREGAVTKYFHGGNGRAYQSVILYGPKDNMKIILLDNMGHRQAQWLGHMIWSNIQGGRATIPRPFLSDLLMDAAVDGQLLAEIEAVRENINGYMNQSEFDESGINALGYQLIAAKRMEEAREVFTLNIEFYPYSGNVYDSMGELEYIAGDMKAARKMYLKSLEVNPENGNARVMLKRIKGK